MFHSRRWIVADVDSVDDLAHKLTEQSWCLCNGFRLAGTIFLNDSTSEDSVAEYAVLRREGDLWKQTESITFGWCGLEKAKEYIQAAIDGKFDAFGMRHYSDEIFAHPEYCELCA